ncbi:MAG: septum formation initiator family protein, partial [Candidatus Moraniibacteriota bacterium]
FDNDNILSQFQARKELNALLQQKKYYTDEIQKNKDLVRSLSTDSKALERFGREKYLMKKDNEDIYLIITDTVKGD